MPIALLVIGGFLAIAGIKNNAGLLGKTIGDDFRGAGSFWYWIVAVIIIGSVGYYSKAENVSRLFLGLIVLVFALSNGGIYVRLVEAIQNPQPAPPNEGAGEPAKAGGGETKNPLGDYSTIPNPFDIFKGPQGLGGALGGTIFNLPSLLFGPAK